MSCKARSGLPGKKWLQDKDSVNGRSANPPYAAVDVVRVVPGNASKFTLR